MTGGFLSVPIMRPNHCWTVLHVSILAGLLLTLNADSEDSNCEDDIRVNHNTVYKAVLGEDLTINCTVVFCHDPPPTVTWYKREKTSVPVNVSSSSHIKTDWEPLDDSKGRWFLIFQKILRNDSGLYHCRVGDSVSHYINVSVHDDDGRTNVTWNNDTRSRILDPVPTEDPWLYMYFAAGTVAFVIIVIIISIVSMRGCKGKSKKETATDNQYVAIPMVEQPLPHGSLQPSPSGSPHAPPSRRSTRRKTPPPQPNESQLSRQNEHVYGKVNENRERRRIKVEEEASTVVYAALNHQLPAGAAARSRRPKEEETSEYAAIRV